MRRRCSQTLFAAISTAALLAACSSSESGSPVTGALVQQAGITVSIGSAQFSATLADTATARAFAERLPLRLDMADVNGNE